MPCAPCSIKVLDVIREALPRETVIASDMTQIAYAANEDFPVLRPRTWIHPVGFGTLGFGLPAGIGAKFGVRRDPGGGADGDYGIQYTINELGTAVEHKLPIIILLWNNERLGAIHDSMANAGIQPNAVTLRNPDFQMLAKAYGCNAEKPALAEGAGRRHQGGAEGRWPDADRDDAAHGQWLEPPASCGNLSKTTEPAQTEPLRRPIVTATEEGRRSVTSSA